MTDWSAADYLRFEEERTRPARDLLARIEDEIAGTVVDMGCGPGNSTELLAERFPGNRVVGVDLSPAMLDAASKRLPAVTFAAADAQSWMPPPDAGLVFANAIYQWVPDHMSALRRVFEALARGSYLAVQMPDNANQPSHRLMREVAAEREWADRLAGVAREPLPPVGAYCDALSDLAERLDIWHTIYQHVVAGPQAILAWVEATGLRPFLEPLSPAERDRFRARYLARVAEAYPPARDGRVLFAFPRLFLLARR